MTTNIDIPNDCDAESSCHLQNDNVELMIDSIDSGFSISWQSDDTEMKFQVCLDLNPEETNWFGGRERKQADWPIENDSFENQIYISTKSYNGGVSERYWLNSKGGFLFVDDKVPLFLDQNNLIQGSMCFISSLSHRYIGRDRVI
jgi:hypothetical protein